MHPHRASSTARLIARSTLLASRDHERHRLVPTGAVAPLAAMLAADGEALWFKLALHHPGAGILLRQLEQLVLPGIITHYLARKLWLERAATAALDGGCTQVVVLGAGFDSLAWRLARTRPDVRFFELDHPATQAPKRKALRVPTNLTFLPADLATVSPTAVLRACPDYLYGCIIFNLHTEHSATGIVRAADAFRALIDLALDCGGSYYLTYHRWARPDQVARAYPQFAEFLRQKTAHDPAHRFQSDWWRHYEEMFAAP